MSALAAQPPVIVVHATTGSLLWDHYPVDPERVWDPTAGIGHLPRKEFLRIALHPEQPRYEAQEPARVLPSNPVPTIYSDLIGALRYDLSLSQDRPTPVFPFAYDWRLDNFESALGLGKFVEEVIQRTNLLRHYGGACRQVDIVAHSMGGLVVAAYLASRRQSAKQPSPVRKVVTIATPFLGAVDAISKMATGEGEIMGAGRDRERETARTLPSLYQLLPWFDGAFVGADDEPLGLFDAANWQPTIIDSIAEFLRLYGVGDAGPAVRDRRQRAHGLLQSLLDGARRFQRRVAKLDRGPDRLLAAEPRAGQGDSNWLVIVGLGEDTRVRARLDAARRFTFEVSKNGDGTVPLAGAVPRWANKQRVVVVTRDEFGPFEIADRVIRSLAGFHAVLPLVNVVQRWVISFLKGRPHGTLFGRSLPEIETWTPPIAAKRLA